MRKRAGLARALALDPEVIFLDEPTSGLDPIGADSFDALLKTLQRALNLTVVLVTHDLDTIFAVCDRVAVLGDRKVIIVDTPEVVAKFDHPWIRETFGGKRGKRAAEFEESSGKIPAPESDESREKIPALVANNNKSRLE